jgi:fermentation-respiration switch protein FrsA (DUF1100 family)
MDLLLRGALVLLALLVAWAWLAFYPVIPADLGGVRSLDAEARPVRIAAAPGDSIDGWYLEGRAPAVVLLLHGHGRDHRRMWRYGRFLREAGYGVLAVDFRCARARRRAPTTLGHYETADAQAALDWLRARRGGGRPIGILGESLGGAVALTVAARNADVAAVIDDSGFASGREAIDDFFTRTGRLPVAPTSLVRAFARAFTGVDPGALDVRQAASALRDRPVLFIHGDADARIAPEQTLSLWRAAGERHPLWIVPGAGHNEGWLRRRQDYERRVTGFLDEHLLGRPGSR